MASQHVLLVEDDRDSADILRRYLERDGFTVSVAGDGPSGLSRALADPPALILLDWMLPGLDGLSLLKRVREARRTPVIMLSARVEEADRILGLEFGADDYVVKPFSPREVVARVRAVLRRCDGKGEGDPDGIMDNTVDDTVNVGGLTLDAGRRTALFDSTYLNLTTLEFDLLYALARRPERVFTRDELLERVWGADFSGVDRVVDVHVSNLRVKLAEVGGAHLLGTVRNVGYRLCTR